MIKFVKIERQDPFYWAYDSNDIGMCHLGNFLTDDVGCYSPTFKALFLDPKFDYPTTSNYSSLEKIGDYILIGFECDDDGPRLKIHLDEIIKILDTWEQFCKTKPKEIIITQDGDKFNIEGIFHSDGGEK